MTTKWTAQISACALPLRIIGGSPAECMNPSNLAELVERGIFTAQTASAAGELIVRGLTKLEIGETLVLSPHTAQDHIKSLFEKLGVGSRQELVACVFIDEYLPEVVRRTPLTSHGRFDVGRRSRART